MIGLFAFTVVSAMLVVLRTRLELARSDIRVLRRRALERAA